MVTLAVWERTAMHEKDNRDKRAVAVKLRDRMIMVTQIGEKSRGRKKT